MGLFQKKHLLWWLTAYYAAYLIIMHLIVPHHFTHHPGMVLGTSGHRSGFKLWFASIGESSSRWMRPFFVYGLNLFLSEGLTATAPVSGTRCTREDSSLHKTFSDPGPLILGSIGGSGASGVMGELNMLLQLQQCRDMDVKMNDVYLLKPEAMFLSEVVANNSLGRVVRHLPNTLANWRNIYDDICTAVGSSIDCIVGCSPIKSHYQNKHFSAGGSSMSANTQKELRQYLALPVDKRPQFLEPNHECPISESQVHSSPHVIGGTTDSVMSWGFKSPNTIFFLPFYQAIFGHQWRFLHLVRDGRDIAFGPNHDQFGETCVAMFGYEECLSVAEANDEASIVRRATMVLTWWSDVNMQAFKWGKAHLGQDRYMILRVEDLATGSFEDEVLTMARLLRFTGASAATQEEASVESESENLCAAVRQHGLGAFPFSGNKYEKEVRQSRIASLGTTGHVALRHFGYLTSDWGISPKAQLDPKSVAAFHQDELAPWYTHVAMEAVRKCGNSLSSEKQLESNDGKVQRHKKKDKSWRNKLNKVANSISEVLDLTDKPLHLQILDKDKSEKENSLYENTNTPLKSESELGVLGSLSDQVKDSLFSGAEKAKLDHLIQSSVGLTVANHLDPHGHVLQPELQPELQDQDSSLLSSSSSVQTPPHLSFALSKSIKKYPDASSFDRSHSLSSPSSLASLFQNSEFGETLHATDQQQPLLSVRINAELTLNLTRPIGHGLALYTPEEVREQLNAAGDYNNSALKCLRHKDFSDPGPLIIGGVGDSGTSAIVSMVQSSIAIKICDDFGGSKDALYMLKPETVYPDKLAGNNTARSIVAHLPWLMPKTLWDKAYTDVCGAIGSTIDCTAGCSVLKTQFQGSVRNMRKVYKIVEDRPTFPPMKCSFRGKEGGEVWGWKGPRSVYFLPFYQAVFKDNFRFLHVLRDGRDVAYGDNQMQFWMLCDKLYGVDFCNRDKVDHHRASLQFWQDVNMQAFKLATEVMGLDRDGGRYMILRVEDLAIPANYAQALARVLDFTAGGHSLEQHQERLKRSDSKSLCSLRLRSDPYEGNKYSKKGAKFKKSQILETVGDVGLAGLEFFGYTPNTWGRFRDPPGRVWELPARRELVHAIGECGFDKPYQEWTPLYSDVAVPAADIPGKEGKSLVVEAGGIANTKAEELLQPRRLGGSTGGILESARDWLKVASEPSEAVAPLQYSQDTSTVASVFNSFLKQVEHHDQPPPPPPLVAAALTVAPPPPPPPVSVTAAAVTHSPVSIRGAIESLHTATAAREEVSKNIPGGLIDTGGPTQDCSLLKHTFKHAPQCEPKTESSQFRLHVYPILITAIGRSATKYMQESLSSIGAQISHDNTEIGRQGAVAWPLAVRETGHLDPDEHEGCNGYELPSFLHGAASNAIGPNPRARFEMVFHQVRDPLKSLISRANRIGMMYSPIAYANPKLFKLLTADFRKSTDSKSDGILKSLQFLSHPNESEVRKFESMRQVGEWTKEKRLIIALFHYVYWNAFIDLYADWVYRIEDTSLLDICNKSPESMRLSVCPNQQVTKTETKKSKISESTNSHEIIDELSDTNWQTVCQWVPEMTSRAQLISIRYGYIIPDNELCTFFV